MTCDLKMSLAVAAEKSIAPVAAQVRRLTKQLDTLRQREISEAEALTKAVDDVARWKSAAGNYLSDGPGAFDKFQTGLKRAIAREAMLKETLVLFKRDLIPHAEQELLAAREKLTQTFTSTVASARADCEARMSVLLAEVVAEHDAFLDAIAGLGRTFGTASRGEPPKIYSPRLDEIKHTLSGKRWVTVRPAPPPPAAPAAPAAAPPVLAVDVPEAVESTPTPAHEESAKGDTPRGETLAPERTSAAAAPLSAEANRARVLLKRPPSTETAIAPAEDSPTPTESPQEAAPTDLDPDTPAPAVAAEAAVDDDAEAPPEAEKENPGIAAETDEN